MISEAPRLPSIGFELGLAQEGLNHLGKLFKVRREGYVIDGVRAAKRAVVYGKAALAYQHLKFFDLLILCLGRLPLP
jgi:hypothetical protein